MSRLSRTEKIIAEKTVCVLLVRGNNPQGTPIFAYVAIRADRLEDFIAAQKGGTFYPEEFGIILESGEGEPSDDVRARMSQEYGFNHDAMLDIPSPARAHEVASNISEHSRKMEGEGSAAQ